jgi:hypothetical protein
MASEVLEKRSPVQIDSGFEDREGFQSEKHSLVPINVLQARFYV